MKDKPRVFVTQIPNKRDHASGRMVPSIDVGPAVEHGEIQVIFPGGFSMFQTDEMVKELRRALATYSFVDGDSLMAIGDPVIIFAAGAVLAESGVKMRLLKWERLVKRYVPVEVSLA